MSSRIISLPILWRVLRQVALCDGQAGVPAAQLLELARNGAGLQGLGQQEHALLQRRQLRQSGLALANIFESAQYTCRYVKGVKKKIRSFCFLFK